MKSIKFRAFAKRIESLVKQFKCFDDVVVRKVPGMILVEKKDHYDQFGEFGHSSELRLEYRGLIIKMDGRRFCYKGERSETSEAFVYVLFHPDDPDSESIPVGRVPVELQDNIEQIFVQMIGECKKMKAEVEKNVERRRIEEVELEDIKMKKMIEYWGEVT